MGPHPAVAAIRLAVRRALHDVLNSHTLRASLPAAGTPLARACGHASMALASALAFEAPRLGLRAGGVTIDHGLQVGSAERAQDVVARLGDLRLAPVEAVSVTVARTRTGPEAAAREARYA